MTLLADLSYIVSVVTDLIIISPILSRRIRRAIFKAVIVDVLYEIVEGEDGELQKLVNSMKKLVTVYEMFNQEKEKKTVTISREEND